MQATEKRVVVVLADISGYTRFMLQNQMSAVHGQQCITFLIETLIEQIDIPLRLQEIEGDALFLYAEDPGTEAGWADVLQQIPAKLVRFFDAFYEGTALAIDATPCKCAICRNGEKLMLKIVVHSGHAVFHKIGGFDKVSGPDVILAHRLLKNSVPDKEYILMSAAAYRDIGQKMQGPFLQGNEHYQEFGAVDTFVRYNGDIKQQHLDSLYQLPRTSLVVQAERYAVAAVAGMFPALWKHLRKPMVDAGWLSRLGFALLFMARAPIMIMMYMVSAPRRLLALRNGRLRQQSQSIEST